MEKERLDVLLVNRGMVESREKAKAIIMTGNVFVNEQREDKAFQKFPVLPLPIYKYPFLFCSLCISLISTV